MKNSIICLLLSFLFLNGFAQTPVFELPGRLTPSINKEQLSGAKHLGDIMPEFKKYFRLPFSEQVQLDKPLKFLDYASRFKVNQQGNDLAYVENFNKIVEYLSVDVVATSNGKTLSAQSLNDLLTPEQKNLIVNADLGTDIGIKIKFRYKNHETDNFDPGSKTKEGEYSVSVVPETEARYPGGFDQFSTYINKTIIQTLDKKTVNEKISQAIVKFTVNEDGHIVDVKIERSSTDATLDKLLLDATKNMPAWSPAKNALGTRVKQEFIIPLGSGGC